MTAILTYYAPEQQRAVIICDDRVTTTGASKIGDKCLFLFSRFAVACYGPDPLHPTLFVLKEEEDFTNRALPKCVDELVNIIQELFSTWVVRYVAEGKTTFLHALNNAGLIILDTTDCSLHHAVLFWSMDGYQVPPPLIETIDPGFSRFALLADIDADPELTVEDFDADARTLVSAHFDAVARNHTREIGGIGTWFEFNSGKIIFESTSTNYLQSLKLSWD